MLELSYIRHRAGDGPPPGPADKRKGRAMKKGQKAKQKKQKGQGGGDAARETATGPDGAVWHRRPKVPPPDSDIWPEEYRGERWKPIFAFLFAGKCILCAHSCPLPRSRRLEDKWRRLSHRLHCTHHPSNPGGIEEVLVTDTCRNFKPKRWYHRPRGLARTRAAPPPAKSRGRTERIPLGNGLFATVDAADYPKVSQYRWYARRCGKTIYAMRHARGGDMYMHRMIMRPRRGYIVHHLDHDGLNNRRDNLRVCTPRQHQSTRGPSGGTSQYVGVYRCKDRWEARIRHRGKVYYLGFYDTEVEAAKARDRKAYELHGEFAYLNFPEDLPALRKAARNARRGKRGSAKA
jgi:hypothetical protein